MGAVSVGTTVTTDKTTGSLLSGGRLPKGAIWKTVEVTLPASYDDNGSALDLSGLFPDRVWFAAPMGAAWNETNGMIPVRLTPGTAKTDGLGGFASSDWKIVAGSLTTVAIEAAGAANLGAYKVTLIVCGQ